MGTYIIEVKTAFGEWMEVETLSNTTVDAAIEAKNQYQAEDRFNVYRVKEATHE